MKLRYWFKKRRLGGSGWPGIRTAGDKRDLKKVPDFSIDIRSFLRIIDMWLAVTSYSADAVHRNIIVDLLVYYVHSSYCWDHCSTLWLAANEEVTEYSNSQFFWSSFFLQRWTPQDVLNQKITDTTTHAIHSLSIVWLCPAPLPIYLALSYRRLVSVLVNIDKLSSSLHHLILISMPWGLSLYK